MTLITCPACTQQVSDRAATCPKCGHPIAGPAEKSDSTPAEACRAKNEVPIAKVPVVIGVAAIILGALAPWFFGAFALASKDLPVETTHVAVGLPALMAILGFAQLPAGIGILLHRSWARRLAQSAAMGLVVVAGLWFAYYLVFSVSQQAGMVGTGFVAGVWAVVINLGLNARSVKQLSAGKQSPK
jgi:hypothetical protein